VLETELEGVRDTCPDTARFWKVVSSDVKNAIGGSTGFKLVPGQRLVPFAPLDRAAHLKRAQFLDHQLWVTPFSPNEKYPG
jgi:primary-amine oxidase